MPDHVCIQQEKLGRIAEFIESTKGVRTSLLVMSLTIFLQVGTFLYLWGGLTETVRRHEISIDKMCKQLEGIQLVGYVYAENKK